MKKLVLANFAAAAFLAIVCVPASASTYNAFFDSNVFDVSATITTDGLNNVTGITGSVAGINGGSITGLEPLGNPNWIYDNLFSGAAPYVTNGGILFTAGAWLYNLYSVAGDPFTYYLSTFNPTDANYNPGVLGTLAVSEVPIPAPFALFGSALALGGLFARRRKQRAAFSTQTAQA